MKKEFRLIQANKLWILFMVFSILVDQIPLGMTVLIEVFGRIALKQESHLILPGIIFLLLWICGCLLFRIAYSKSKSKVIYEWNCRMKSTLMDRLLRRKVADFTAKDRAEYISVFNNDIKFVEEKYLLCLNKIASNLALFTASLIYSFRINVLLTLVILAAGLFIFFMTKKLSGKAAQDHDAHFLSLKTFNESLQDGLYGYETLYRSLKNANFMKLFSGKLDKVEKNHAEAVYSSGMLVSLINYLSISIQASLFLALALAVYYGKMDGIYYPVMMSLMNLIIYPMEAIGENYGSIKSSEEVRKRLLEEIRSGDSEKEEPAHPSAKPEKNEAPSIAFRDVDFSYGDKPIFEKANFEIRSKEHILLCGDSGSGKSTILKLLTGESEAGGGEILLGERPASSLSRQEIFDQISVIPQHPMMFRTSILQNIVLFEEEEEIDFERLERVLHKAGLHSYLDSLPEGIHTILTDAGSNLSGGEKQRIEIARALYRDTPIILIDEATAGLDLGRAKSLEEIFASFDKTLISISHRRDIDLSKFYDRSLRVKDRKILSEEL
ncbi:MAG: ABC transporter ATP-binding protein [Peptostreptococcaceae bacterium]|nr:ABC transporter ATP-binding protein [Peptostreptococcaceae bacterium]